VRKEGLRGLGNQYMSWVKEITGMSGKRKKTHVLLKRKEFQKKEPIGLNAIRDVGSGSLRSLKRLRNDILLNKEKRNAGSRSGGGALVGKGRNKGSVQIGLSGGVES